MHINWNLRALSEKSVLTDDKKRLKLKFEKMETNQLTHINSEIIENSKDTKAIL